MTTTLALADFSSKSQKQRLNVIPYQIAAYRPLEDEFQSAAVFPLHIFIVLLNGTVASFYGL